MQVFRVYLFICLVFSSYLSGREQEVEKVKVDVVVVGSGAGGLTASIYLARGGLRPYVLEGGMPGGAATQSTSIQNWPGEFSIGGAELMGKVRDQAIKNQVVLADEELTSVDLSSRPYKFCVQNVFDPSKKKEITAEACIIATGSTPRLLGVPGEEKYKFRGVYTCAICDGTLYQDKIVGIVGGGDSAVLEASYLSGIAKKVYVFVRKDHFRAMDKERVKQIKELPNVEIRYNIEVKEISGTEESVQQVHLVSISGKEEILPLDALFLAIGSTPNSQMFSEFLELDSQGYIALREHFSTSVPGVFAIGDVVDPLFKQAISAAGDGAKAAIQVQSFLPAISREEVEIVAKAELIDHTVEVNSLRELEDLLEHSGVPVLLDFYATWCGPCRRLSPFIESTASELAGKFIICKVNVDTVRELTTLYGIRSMPTLVEVDTRGKEIVRKQGTEEIRNFILGLKHVK